MSYGNPFDPFPFTASLQGPSDMQRVQNPQVSWTREQVYYPEPLVASNPQLTIARQIRLRPLNFTSLTQNQETVQTITFDRPTIVYAVSAAQALSDSLNNFRIRYETGTFDRVSTVSALGSTMAGTGGRPFFFGGPSLRFDNGASFRVGVTALVTGGINVDVTLWTLEQPGPTNISAIGG
jgi:hypothetical protein